MRATAAMLTASLLVGCGGPGPTEWQYAPGARPADYDDALNTWTRSAETYEYFESRVFVRATWFSPAFAAAYVDYQIERLGLSPDEAEALLERTLEAARGEVRFFVAVVTNDPLWNDMHQKDGTLRATLRVGEEAIDPIRVDKLDDDEMADVRPFFPYADPLTTGYFVTFPLPEERRRLQLRIAGPPAVIDLVWKTR